VVALLAISDPAVKERIVVLRAKAERFVEVRDRSARLIVAQIGPAAGEMNLDESGVQSDGGIEVFDRAIVRTFEPLRERAMVEDETGARRQANRLVVISDRAIVVRFPSIGGASVDERKRVIGPEPQRGIEVIDCTIQMVLAGIGLAAVPVVVGFVR